MHLSTGIERTIHDDIDMSFEENGQEQKKRKCSTALYVDEKQKKLEKKSERQTTRYCYVTIDERRFIHQNKIYVS